MKWSTDIGPRRKVTKRLTTKASLAIETDPRLLDENDPLRFAFELAQTSGDPRDFDRFISGLRSRQVEQARNSDPFLRNLPTRQVIRRMECQGGAPLVYLNSGQALRLPLGKYGTSLNELLCAPTGAGKTNAQILQSLSFSGRAIQLRFDRKGDLARLVDFNQPGEVVILDARRDVPLSLSDGLDLLGAETQVAQIVNLFAFHLSLHASRRLLTNILSDLLRQEGSAGLQLRRVVSTLERLEGARTSKIGGYRDSLLFALTDLLQRSGTVFDSPPSNFLDRLLSEPRTFVILTGGLGSDHSALLTSLIYRYVYERRRVRRETELPVIIAIDDAMPFATGSAASEREGRSHPIANWAHMGRAMQIGLAVSVQNASLVSPTLLNNTGSMVCLGAYGSDATAVKRFMSLTDEQAAVLPTLRPGEAVAICRPQWPYAVRGHIPEVKL